MIGRYALAVPCCIFLGLCLGCAQVNLPTDENISVEDRIHECICAIIDDIAQLKDGYPELADFSPTTMKHQIGPRPDCKWAMSFKYSHNYQHAIGKGEGKGPKFGKHGCFLVVDFRKIDSIDQRVENMLIPSLGVKVFWSCDLPKDGPQELNQAFDTTVKRQLEKFKKDGT